MREDLSLEKICTFANNNDVCFCENTKIMQCIGYMTAKILVNTNDYLST
jgi:hypothetical protein